MEFVPNSRFRFQEEWHMSVEIYTVIVTPRDSAISEVWCAPGKRYLLTAPSEAYTVTVTDLGRRVVEEWRWITHHRSYGPAVVERDMTTGIVVRENWLKHGLLHRTDGPAIICRNAETGKVNFSRWMVEGKRIPAPHPVRSRSRPIPACAPVAPSGPVS
jgi:hypothetical protein